MDQMIIFMTLTAAADTLYHQCFQSHAIIRALDGWASRKPATIESDASPSAKRRWHQELSGRPMDATLQSLLAHDVNLSQALVFDGAYS